jgi:hypothetical protein
MPSPAEREILRQLRSYLDGRLELHQFEDWFVPVLWRDLGDDAARDLAAEIHILIAEYSRGDRSECSLREELHALSRPLAPNAVSAPTMKPSE